jgi:hypothetical protein
MTSHAESQGRILHTNQEATELLAGTCNIAVVTLICGIFNDLSVAQAI